MKEYLGERYARLYAQTRRGEMQEFNSYVSALDLRLVPDDELTMPWNISAPITPPRPTHAPSARPCAATSRPTSASSAAASPAVRPRCTWPSAAIESCCSKAHRVGWGASGRSGGQVIFGLRRAARTSCRRRSAVPTRERMFDLSVEAVDTDARACRTPSHRLRPALGPPARRDQAAPRKRAARVAGGTGPREQLHVGRLARCAPNVRELLATERYIGGLYDDRSGHLHPLNYTLGLAAAAEAAGALMHERAPS